MSKEKWVWLVAGVLGLGFWAWRALAAPLPFYGFQSDPELHYYINSLLPANGLAIEHTDHPGTALQWLGAILARGLGLRLADAFNPVALQHFYFCWRGLALVSLLGTGLWLAHRLKGRGAWVIAALVLLPAFDYQTLVYWLTFTPESAFFVLYLPIALCALLRSRRAEGCSWREGLLWAALLGFITTLKLTLWPVTLFVLAQLAVARPAPGAAPTWRRFLAFLGLAVVTFVVVASLFARDRAAPWRWMLALIAHTGRYGAARPGEGFFPPLTVGLEALRRSFALQDDTTLPVFGAVIAVAIWAWRAPKFQTDRRARALTSGFIVALLLLVLMFFKHPYQGKYLMPASVLLVLYTAAQAEAGRFPPVRWTQLLCLIFGFSAANAFLTQKILFDHVLARDARISSRIDSWLAVAPHDALIFSSRLPHPLPAFREALRPPLQAEFARRFGRVELTGTYSLDFQRVAASELPSLPGVRHAIAFLNTPTADPRWRLVEAIPEDELYVYFPRSIPPRP